MQTIRYKQYNISFKNFPAVMTLLADDMKEAKRYIKKCYPERIIMDIKETARCKQ